MYDALIYVADVSKFSDWGTGCHDLAIGVLRSLCCLASASWHDGC